MKKILLAVMAFPVLLTAQNKSIDSVQLINETVVSTSKFGENKREIAQEIKLIKSDAIEKLNTQSSADLLLHSGYVHVQKSQQGGGSPSIRGFEASRVLLVVDGVRMNNAIYRAGHLQNVVTIDANILDRIEVLYGPASTQFGSDALGGVVQLITKKPKLNFTDKKLFASGNGFFRYGSVNNETTAHVDFNLGGKRWASLTSATFSNFGDLKSGRNGNGGEDSMWLLDNYVIHVNGKDSVISNPDPLKQKNSGFYQYDLLQKFLFQKNEYNSHTLNLQFSNSSNVPRYDRLSETTSNKPSFSEWYYGPQTRVLAAYEYAYQKPGAIFDEAKAGLNYQYIVESRHSRRLNKTFVTKRYERIHVPAFYAHFRKKINLYADLQFGFETQLNFLNSSAYDYNANADTTRPASTRYPDGKNSMHNVAVYIQNKSTFLGNKIILSEGIRYTYSELNSTFVDTTFFNFPFKEIRNKYHSASGNIGLVFLPIKGLKISAMGSSGFRAPNIDDMSKIFESVTGTLFVPNSNLKPEYTINGDLSIDYSYKDIFNINLTGFYTYFLNAITADQFTYNGSDSIEFEGVKSKVFALQNKNRAFTTGVSGSIKIQPLKNLVFESSLNYIYGRIFTDSTLYPLDHIAPLYGKTSLSYTFMGFTAQTYFLYNGAKKLKDYNLLGEDNLNYATPEGTPAWWTWNLKLSARVNKYFGVDVGVENILDKKYRVFASGISGPGRNFYATVRFGF